MKESCFLNLFIEKQGFIGKVLVYQNFPIMLYRKMFSPNLEIKSKKFARSCYLNILFQLGDTTDKRLYPTDNDQFQKV